ncbi:4'-phosphopantetheinyl transferase family protein [Stenotrophomonas sp. GZD-301]|uniref:4'-phosphopantetheinyl transferase family protein n=1 Tax=Stenotrophomonas sp. GZD-301 TaxID=3404814 RepID=UPI003BB57FBC
MPTLPPLSRASAFLGAHNAYERCTRGVVIHGYACAFHQQYYCDALFDEYGVAAPASVMAAVEKRRSEFLVGRLCARHALAAVGCDVVHVAVAADRSPQWPVGVRASLSHAAGRAVCIATVDASVAGLGVDVEGRLTRVAAAEVRDQVLAPQEVHRIASEFSDPDLGLVLAFSAKESIFKALYAHVGAFFGFDAVELTCCLPGEFEFVVCDRLSPSVRAGMRIRVGYDITPTQVETWVCVLWSDLELS